MRRLLSLLFASVTVATLPCRAAAQDPTSLTGLVSDEAGQRLGSAVVVIEGMNLGTLANERGRYLMIVPASRVRPGPVQVTASLIGRTSQTRAVTLQPGTMTLDFSLGADPLNLEEIVVTGSGLATRRARLGVSINSVRAEEIGRSRETEDADFARLRNVSARFELPGSWTQRLGATGASFTIMGENLALFTKYSGLDPEVNYAGGDGSSRAEFFTLPLAKRVVGRLSITF